jgi:hypothetical protein
VTQESGLGIRVPKPEPRSPIPTRAVLATAALTLALSGCTGARERALLDRFFTASRLRDLTALHNVATVVFEPREQGTVLQFDITAIQHHGDDEEVSVSATIRTPAGDVVQRTLLVTITGGFVTSVALSPPRS